MKNQFPNLFSELKLAQQTIKNRIVFPAMGTNFANADGTLSNTLKEYYIERARGGAGMLIMETTLVDYPTCSGQVIYRQVKLKDPRDKTNVFDLTEKIHAYGAKILFQPHHGGWRANRMLNSDWVAPYDTTKLKGNWPVARGLDTEEVYKLIESYVETSKNAQECGADGIEIMAGHGYLIYSFLNEVTNCRTDEFGGSLEKRTFVLQEIIRRTRESCGKDFIIGVKLGVLDDPLLGHMTVDEGGKIAAVIKKAGPDFIETSMGFYTADNMVIETYDKPDYFRRPLVEGVRPYVDDLPLMTVGKIRDPKEADEIIKSGTAQLVGIGRQLICDPYWPKKVLEGRVEEIRKCLSCNEGCTARMRIGREIRCVVNPYVGYEYKYHENSVPATAKAKKVIIIGGGISGMQCAIIAAKRGHSVTLIEETSELGGLMKYAAIPPHKGLVGDNLQWFKQELNRQKIQVKLNCSPTTSEILALDPDIVILSTGFKENIPQIPGIETAISAISLLKGEIDSPTNRNIVVIGGGLIGCETAHYIAEKGNKVSIIEIQDTICAGFETTAKPILMKEFSKLGVDIYTSANVELINENGVMFRDNTSSQKYLESGLTVYATGFIAANTDLGKMLRDEGISVMPINEYSKGSNFREATCAALEIAYDI